MDLPSVDWIVQYNAPVSAEDYVHRVGRTARVGKCGQALLFLAPAEAGFVQRLAGRGVAMTETSPDVLLKSLLKTYSRSAAYRYNSTRFFYWNVIPGKPVLRNKIEYQTFKVVGDCKI